MNRNYIVSPANSLPIRDQRNNKVFYYNYLVQTRASREGSFITDRGFRHINNRGDRTGVTYAFWLKKDRK